MKRAGKAETKKRKIKAAEAPLVDEKTLEAELERRLILELFYECVDTIFDKCCLVLMGVQLFLFFVLPGGRHHGAVGFCYWFLCYTMSKYVGRYKGTEHEMYGKKLAQTFVEVLVPINEVLKLSDNSLASEEGKNAHAAMVILFCYCCGSIVHRLASPRYTKGPLWAVVVYPLLAYYYPRFGIFPDSRYEALAWFVTLCLGWTIATIIDEMRWKHFLSIHKMKVEMAENKRKLLKSIKRAEAFEELACRPEPYFFEVIR